MQPKSQGGNFPKARDRQATTDQGTREVVQPVYADPQALATRTGISADTWSKWRYLGIGPKYIKVSPRKILYLIEDVDRFLEARKVQSTAQADQLPKGA